MPQDFLQLSTTFGRDFRELRSTAEHIAGRVNPDDPSSVEAAVLEAAKFIETRCAQGGATMIFQPSRSFAERERLSDAFVRLVLQKIEGKHSMPE
jgi:hypothetical protein